MPDRVREPGRSSRVPPPDSRPGDSGPQSRFRHLGPFWGVPGAIGSVQSPFFGPTLGPPGPIGGSGGGTLRLRDGYSSGSGAVLFAGRRSGGRSLEAQESQHPHPEPVRLLRPLGLQRFGFVVVGDVVREGRIPLAIALVLGCHARTAATRPERVRSVPVPFALLAPRSSVSASSGPRPTLARSSQPADGSRGTPPTLRPPVRAIDPLRLRQRLPGGSDRGHWWAGHRRVNESPSAAE